MSFLNDEVFDISSIIDFEELDDFIDQFKGILEVVSENICTILKVYFVEDDYYYLQSEFFISITNTLNSVVICSKIGHIVDSHVLLRKLRDDLFQWLFLLSTIEIINQEKINSLGKNDAKDNFELSKIMGRIKVWFEDTLSNNPNLRIGTYDYSKYIEHLKKNNAEINECYSILLKRQFDNLADLNNYVHGNGRDYVFSNNFKMDQTKKYKTHLDSLTSKINDLIQCYLSTLMLLSPDLLMSSDYFDSLEHGNTPEERMKTMIAPVFQEYFDKFVKQSNMDLIDFLNIRNKYSMIIK